VVKQRKTMKNRVNVAKNLIPRDRKHSNFWAKLSKPFFVLAPMANVTDSVFRKLFAKYGKPDVTWTEFVSADGLMSAGRNKLLHNLDYTNKERPIVAQLFTGHKNEMKGASRLVAELGFDGVDINMGCPDKAVEKQGGGASLIKNPNLAVEIIESARKGVIEAYEKKGKKKFPKSVIPVSVKTRIGYNKIDMDWIRNLLEQKLPVLTVHLRTRKEMSDVPAHWEIMPEIIKLKDEISPETKIIGNGDVVSMEDGRAKILKSGCDGVMVGRGIFGKPWFFSTDVSLPETTDITFRLGVLVEHAKAFEKAFKNIKSFDVMKKHFKAYVSGWDGAKELRVELMGAKNAKEVSEIVRRYLIRM
jgi:nifR3 family TIM-barrel protein